MVSSTNDAVYTYNSQGEWETGTFYNLIASSPAGKLCLAMSLDQVAEFVLAGALAVYCRCDEGSGTALDNLGLAANGVLSGATWKTRTDGRVYLTDGGATVAYHASMAIAGGDGKKYDASGGIIFRVTALSAQVLMTRANRFILGIDASGKPYVSYKFASGWYTITGRSALVVNTWYGLSFTANRGSVLLSLDGEVVARLAVSGVTCADDPLTGLVVAVTGDWTDFFYFGDGTSGVAIARPSTSGYWEKTIQFDRRRALRHCYVNSDKLEAEHSLSVAITFADSEEDLEYQGDRRRTWTVEDGENWLEPAEENLHAGTWALIRVTLGAGSWHRQVPLVDQVVATFREVTAALTEPDETGVNGGGGLPEELRAPENLEEALVRIAELQESVREIKKNMGSSFGGDGGAGGGESVSDWADEIERFMGFWTGAAWWRQGNEASELLSRNTSEILQVLVDGHFSHRDSIEELWEAMDQLAVSLTAFVTAQIDASVLEGGAVDNAIDALIATHNADVYDVHGIAATADLQDSEDVATAIGVHALLSYGVHGSPNIGDPLMTDSGVDALVTAHGNLTYGTHGCPNLISDMEDDVDPAIASAVSAHAGAADPHTGYCLESAGYATDAEVSSAISTHNGAVAAHSGQGWIDSAEAGSIADGAVSDHNSDVNAHSARGWLDDADVDAIVSIHDNSAGAHDGGCVP